MKTICIDAGNTLVKVAIVEDSVIQSIASFAFTDTCGLLHHLESLPHVEAGILSSVSIADQAMKNVLSDKAAFFMELTALTTVPIRNLYKTPETLGKDRLAAVVGSHSLYPGKNILVMDAGTALTIDFIDSDGNYRGGNISPGLNMRFKALHDYTKRLPLQTKAEDYQLIGNSTEAAITSGVQNGIIFEMNYYVNHFVNQFPDLVTILTGGDGNFFVNKIEKHIFAEPNLVFIGLEKIIEFNIRRCAMPEDSDMHQKHNRIKP